MSDADAEALVLAVVADDEAAAVERGDMPSEREVHTFRAKLAEQTGRYDEMLVHVRKLVNVVDTEMSREEANLISVGFKNVISQLRSSWRALAANETDAEKKMEFREAKVEPRIVEVCKQLHISVDRLLRTAESTEGRIFLMKLKADYIRYECELLIQQLGRSLDPVGDDLAIEAVELYKEATLIAQEELEPTDPILLGLALNFSVFYFDILGNPERAIYLAKLAFDKAIDGLDGLSRDLYRDATLLLQLIRDNLTLWTHAAEKNARAREAARSSRSSKGSGRKK